ncbi:MAG: hypothetical protein ACP5LZ_07850 [Fervidicoccaceae archaeon]
MEEKEVKECWDVFESGDVISTEYSLFEIESNKEDIEDLKRGKDQLWYGRIYEILQKAEVKEKVKEILRQYNVNVDDLCDLKCYEHAENDYIDYCDRDCNCVEISAWIDNVETDEDKEKIIMKINFYSKPN